MLAEGGQVAPLNTECLRSCRGTIMARHAGRHNTYGPAQARGPPAARHESYGPAQTSKSLP